MNDAPIQDEVGLVRAARAVLGGGAGVAELRGRIADGGDPLGEALCAVRGARERRPLGQVLTPPPVVDSMLAWASGDGEPARVVDPGAGSGRFLLAAARRWPNAALLGVEVDPLAALVARANLAAAGLADRSRVLLADYRSVRLPRVGGRTLFVGNPPYVRHHAIAPAWKEWFAASARAHGIAASRLAGLHVHFFLATLAHAAPGDTGVFVTAAEWLDVNYGRALRELLLGPLGAESVHVLGADAEVFAGTATTAAITCFRVGSAPPAVRLRAVAGVRGLGSLTGGRPVARAELAAARRWGALVVERPAVGPPDGFVALGELCRVHRGQVTGANAVWILRRAGTSAAMADAASVLPPCFLFPAVTRARELFDAGETLRDAAGLRLVVDLPPDLDALVEPERLAVERFLAAARDVGAADGYIARTRRPWWRVGLRAPAPVLATYMARRPPAFVTNAARACHVNIAHGLYPRTELDEHAVAALVRYLRRSVSLVDGRTYAGGLTKFEPREMERLVVPGPAWLLDPVARAELLTGGGAR